MPQTPLARIASYQALIAHYARTQAQSENCHMRDLFAAEPDRFNRFSIKAAGLTLDYSKNPITEETRALLLQLARDRYVESRRDAMFAGEKINNTEHRAVLHTALRAPRGSAPLIVDGQDVYRDVHAVLDQMRDFVERVRSGAWVGYRGDAVTDVVNIGIGGSYLGPQVATQALRAYVHPRMRLHFVSNVDGHDLDSVLSQVDPATTLFIVSSKSFVTQETLMNAQSARDWFLRKIGDGGGEADLARHFVAISTNTEAVAAFGIDTANMFPFWDWVGGRYSMWSAIGLSVALAVGFDNFAEMLAGAHAMDVHFRDAPLAQNMPVMLALVGIWHRNVRGAASVSIAPYHQDLRHLPAYLQQLEMESNGKRIGFDGSPLETATCPVIWGDAGTNGQHAFFQLLHQGTDITPVDFIAVLRTSHDLPGHHAVVLANCFAQSEAFMRGKSADEAAADMRAQGQSETEIDMLLPHKTFPGNRPSNTILMEALTPASLGALIALYEHKTFVQGAIWGINSFDQWGVELGKVLAKSIQAELGGASRPERHDGSTNALIALAKQALSA
ncbi:glucose-6-phosphate isomerase [Oxalobacteraceae bacterium CAVE-383]|nr:glucose-6-phosphate isomerase [Oxalobacteraceae bacterium CAVE-383]